MGGSPSGRLRNSFVGLNATVGASIAMSTEVARRKAIEWSRWAREDGDARDGRRP